MEIERTGDDSRLITNLFVLIRCPRVLMKRKSAPIRRSVSRLRTSGQCVFFGRIIMYI